MPEFQKKYTFAPQFEPAAEFQDCFNW